MSKLINDRYLGDAVYASFDGYSIVLDLRAQALPGEPPIAIVLEPQVLRALNKFKHDIEEALKRSDAASHQEPKPPNAPMPLDVGPFDQITGEETI